MVRGRTALARLACAAVALLAPTGCARTCVDDGLHARQSGEACLAATTTEPDTTGTTAATDCTCVSTTEVDATADDTSSTYDTTTTTTDDDASTGDLCADGQQSPGESDVDCGGPCPLCGPTRGCFSEDDCESALCHPLGFCSEVECFNNVHDPGIEWYLDCGGLCGPTCRLGFPCEDTGDCLTGTCEGPPDARTCVLDPVCANGVLDDDVETDVDCGGVCGPSCANFQNGDDDPTNCMSNMTSGFQCFEPACLDGDPGPGEIDVDCGGVCSPCAPGMACIVDGDCQTELCSDSVCQ